MSVYTTEVRFICESYCGLDKSKDYLSVDEIIEQSVDKIFDFKYPIFDENYRKVLECKILKHYYTREICCESVGLWKLFLNRRMNEIMPYYNQLYKSELIEFNPLYDIDLTTSSSSNNNSQKTNKEDSSSTDKTTLSSTGKSTKTGTEESSGNSSGSTTSDDEKWDIYSETPQGTISNLDNMTYLTNARKNTDNSSATDKRNSSSSSKSSDNISSENNGTNNTTRSSTFNSNGNINTTQEYLQTIQGKHGGNSNSKLLMEYRQTFLNIDLEIINKMEDLFFQLW